MSYINIKFNEEIRKIFQKGEEINFDFSDKDVILITGPNGSGKSTLINSLRSHICSNDDRQDKILDTANLQYSEIRSELKPYTEVNTDFDNIFYLSSEFDDPLSMYTTWDACAFIDNGGWATSHVVKDKDFFISLLSI
jgi:ABC-type multidrug transport system ATPase subunit